jgi:hypothetical protein
MSRASAHHDLKAIRGGQARAVHKAEAAHGHIRVIVERQRAIDLRAVHHAIGDHRAHAADAFLGRLEHQLHRAGKLWC